MKRLLAVLLAVLMLLSITPLGAFADSEGDVLKDESGACHHEYNNDCDNDCNLCGAWRDTDHSWERYSYREPTCNTVGIARYFCPACGDSYAETFPATGKHVYDDDTDPDCNYCGAWREIEACDHAYKTPCDNYCYLCGAYRDADHVWITTTEYWPPCKEGYRSYYCAECKLSEDRWIPAVSEHVYDDDTDDTCNECGAWREVESEEHIHEWMEKGSKQPTCTEDGMTILCCLGCGETILETIPAFGHAYDDDYDATCNNCGETREVAECKHEYDYACAAECYLCGAIREVEHAWYLINATEPTCSTAGLYRYKCELCGEPYMEKIPATGKHEYDNDADPDCNNCGEKRDVEECPHKYTVKVLMAATCAKGGLKRYTCVMCGDSYEESTPPTGEHVYDNDADADCNNCGEKREVEVHVHEWMEKDSQQPTCTTDGWTRLYCPGCGMMTRETIPAFGHAYDDDADPDCNNCGEKREVEGECAHEYKTLCDNYCYKCGEWREAGHMYQTTADVAPPCAENYVKEYVCMNCGHSYSQVMTPSQDHVYDDDSDLECNVCGEVREIHVHEWMEKGSKPATCTEDGLTTLYCPGCGIAIREIVPALGHAYDSDFDPDCNNCGESRNVLAPHIYGAVNTDSVNWGETFTLSVMLENNPGLVGWQVSVAFNENVLDLVDWSVGTAFPVGGMSFGPGQSPFTATFADFIHPDVTANGLLYTLTFRVKAKAPAGATLLEIYTTDARNFTNSLWEDIPTTFTDASVTVLEHAHTYTATVVKPTCDTPGYTTYVCKACGDSYTEPTSAQGHKYAAAVVEPTCTADGYTLYACTDCDNSYRDKVIPAFGHAYDDDFDADCNNCGEVREVACPHAYKNPEAPVCAFCGEMLSLSDMLTVYGVSDNAQLTRGDTFTLTVMIKNNPGLVGWRVYVGFDESVLELVNQTGDAKWSNTTFGPQKSPANVMFADAIHPDVEGDGTMFTLTFRVREDAAFGTSLLDVYVKDSMDFYDRAWGEFEISTVDTAVVVSDHTHTYDGVCDGACNICGFTRDAEEHTYDNACDAACNGCGLVRKVEPHPYTSQVTAPTCTADGFTVYTCSICGDRYVDDIVPAPGHNHKGKVTTEPTCEGEGVMTYVCTACGDTYTQSIPALGHDYTVTVFDPDCVNDGYTLHSCNRCRYSYTDEIVPALGHKAGAPADCENAQTCTVCGVELTPALGHDYDAVVTAPTCTTDGYTTHTCANCGDTYVDSVVTALGHKYDNACDPTCNTCGESREVGDHVYDHDYDAICNECGYEREIPYIPGDVNDDGKVNVRDQGLLQQHLNGWEVTINLAAADVNRDGKVNVRDQGLLQQYLNGWDVTLK